MMFKKVKTCFSFKKTVYYETRNAEMQLSATYNGVMSISSNAREIEKRVLNSDIVHNDIIRLCQFSAQTS